MDSMQYLCVSISEVKDTGRIETGGDTEVEWTSKERLRSYKTTKSSSK